MNKEIFTYTSDVSSSGKHSVLLTEKNPFSPSIVFAGEELLKDTAVGKRIASVQFYWKEGSIQPEEGILVVSIESDSGIYYYKEVGFNTVSPVVNKWNRAAMEIPVNEIRANRDVFKIYVWSPKLHKQIYIDDLQFEIAYLNPK